jgi:2'-5' RNA ligase
MSGRQRLLVAALLRGRQAHEVDALRRVLGSSELDRIAPHITLIAPINVPDQLVAGFGASIEAGVAASAPISLELDGVATFSPDHHVIYLQVAGALDELSALRERCSANVQQVDARPFVPHVTLKSHANRDLVGQAMTLMGRFALSLSLDRITLLRRDESSTLRAWEPYDEIVLGSLLIIGRGGRELALSRATMLSAQDHDFISANAEEPDAVEPDGAGTGIGGSIVEDTGREMVVVRARIDGQRVGVVVAQLHGEFCVLEHIVVDTARRREGIGRQMMSYLERGAEELGIHELIVETGENAFRFFGALGFHPISGDFGDRSRARMNRAITG